jgi:hypothetical protein
MEEAERRAIDRPAAGTLAHLVALQAPVGEVQGGVAQDRQVVDEARGQVHPALVGKQALREVHPAVEAAALAPPVDQRQHLRRRAHGGEAQVVDAGGQDRLVVRHGFAGQWAGEVRDQRQLGGRERRAHLVERPEDVDVGVEVGDRAGLAEQPPEGRGLDRRVELQGVVVDAHRREPGLDLGGGDHLGERLDRRHRPVGRDHHAPGLRLGLGEALHEGRGLGGVVPRDDGEDDVQS